MFSFDMSLSLGGVLSGLTPPISAKPVCVLAPLASLSALISAALLLVLVTVPLVESTLIEDAFSR